MPDDKTERNKAAIIEQLRRIPIIQVIVERVGVARSTFYRWKTEDRDFNEKVNHAIKEGRGLITDLAESQLINNIKNGHMTAIIFWLKYNDGRYSDRQQLAESEIQRIIGLFNDSNNRNDVHQTLARMILERRMPIAIAKVIHFFLSAITRSKKDKNLRERLEILSTVIKSDKIKS